MTVQVDFAHAVGAHVNVKPLGDREGWVDEVRIDRSGRHIYYVIYNGAAGERPGNGYYGPDDLEAFVVEEQQG